MLNTINYTTSSTSYTISSIANYNVLCVAIQYDSATYVYFDIPVARLKLGRQRLTTSRSTSICLISLEYVDNTHLKIWGDGPYETVKLYGVK